MRRAFRHRMIHLESRGRGRAYTARRGVVESLLRVAYAGGWPAALWGAIPRARRVERTHHVLRVLPAGSAPIRVGFVSDLHLGPTTPRALLDAAFAHLADARLDLLVLGGDYVFLDATAEKAALLASHVERVPAARKVAVLGNHDLWTDHARIERALAAAGVEILVNASVRHRDLVVVGLDDPWTGLVDAPRAFAGAADARALLVVCHSPDALPDAERALGALPRAPRAVYVCGHTHGGHLATPWGPIVVPGRLGRRYPAGLFTRAALDLYVSRGVGGIELPIRAWARPEVAVIDLV